MEDMNHGKDMEETPSHSHGDTPQAGPPSQANHEALQAQRISAAQHRRLEARIKEHRLDRERVKDWMIRASKGRVNHFTELTQALYQKLDAKLEVWAMVRATQQQGSA
jgi:hypothetical protein